MNILTIEIVLYIIVTSYAWKEEDAENTSILIIEPEVLRIEEEERQNQKIPKRDSFEFVVDTRKHLENGCSAADCKKKKVEKENKVNDNNTNKSKEERNTEDGNAEIGEDEGGEDGGAEDENESDENLSYNIKEEAAKKRFKEAVKEFLTEQMAGNKAEVLGTNQHYYQSKTYPDLNRRFVPQYTYREVSKSKEIGSKDEILPEKAPAELVLMVAKESAKQAKAEPRDTTADFDPKKILRSGDYWNGVWKEEVYPKSLLRSGPNENNLSGIKANIKPGNRLYDVVKNLKKISSDPRFIYIINKPEA